MKNKFKSYSFWMSVTAAIILVINNLGNIFGFEVDGNVITKIVDSICGVLILFGVITMTKKDEESAENIEVNSKSDDEVVTKDVAEGDETSLKDSQNLKEIKKSFKINAKDLKNSEIDKKFSMNKTSIKIDENEM